MTSPDGANWTQAKLLANIEMGDYQISWPYGNRLATAFDFHPKPGGLNAPRQYLLPPNHRRRQNLADRRWQNVRNRRA